jgi:hypothetical protein
MDEAVTTRLESPNTCLYCGTALLGRQAKYCSESHRVMFARSKKSVTETTVPEGEVHMGKMLTPPQKIAHCTTDRGKHDDTSPRP